MPEHKTITDPDIHEPKGIATAVIGTTYVADGTGSGTWTNPKLSGQTLANTNDIPLSDGFGSVVWGQPDSVVDAARVHIINGSFVIALPTASDSTLHTPADYVDITSNYTQAFNYGATFDATNHIVIQKDGLYRVAAWIAVSQDSASSPTLGFDLNINGSAAGANSAVVKVKSKTAGDISTITGFGVGTFSVGDVIGVSLASTSATNVTIYESVLGLQKIGTV